MTRPYSMQRRRHGVRATLLIAALVGGAARAETRIDTSVGPVVIRSMALGLEEPWGIAFLPDGRFLVTERGGRLTLFAPAGGEGRRISGLPAVVDRGQGGLLDVMVPRDFATSRELWLSFAKADAFGAGTALGKGRLSEDGSALVGFTTVFAAPGTPGGNHFGSRIVEAPDGTIFLTTGERGDAPLAQDPMRPEGKVLHLDRDGTPATAHPGMLPGVYSLGHRNAQGAALDAAGQLWLVEHGARGGDEINRVISGRNYGWPVIAHGLSYGGAPIGEGTSKPGMEQPVTFWDPSIAPSGLAILTGRMFPGWQGDFLTGSLNGDHIARLDPDRGFAEERIQTPETARVRDVVEGPDGAVWFLSVNNGGVFRITPAP